MAACQSVRRHAGKVESAVNVARVGKHAKTLRHIFQTVNPTQGWVQPMASWDKAVRSEWADEKGRVVSPGRGHRVFWIRGLEPNTVPFAQPGRLDLNHEPRVQEAEEQIRNRRSWCGPAACHIRRRGWCLHCEPCGASWASRCLTRNDGSWKAAKRSPCCMLRT